VHKENPIRTHSELRITQPASVMEIPADWFGYANRLSCWYV